VIFKGQWYTVKHLVQIYWEGLSFYIHMKKVDPKQQQQQQHSLFSQASKVDPKHCN